MNNYVGFRFALHNLQGYSICGLSLAAQLKHIDFIL